MILWTFYDCAIDEREMIEGSKPELRFTTIPGEKSSASASSEANTVAIKTKAINIIVALRILRLSETDNNSTENCDSRLRFVT